jgi:aminomethyltransferase
MSADLKKTPLHAWHIERGGRMVEFGGWHMPVQFAGIVSEHNSVRQRAGLFDVSHMGEIRIRGGDALAFVQRLVTNDMGNLEVGQARYTVMTNLEGGILDDLLVYRLADEDFLLVVNAATTPKDVAWVRQQADQIEGDFEVEDQSSQWAQLAIQGPSSEAILARVVPVDLSSIRYYRCAWTEFNTHDALISRTGYTGEDGFEVYLPAAGAVALAEALMEAGAPEGLQPVGLGARDTLRLEAGMLLYGNDMDESRSPIEAGLRWTVKPDKGPFNGRDPLVEQMETGTAERLVGFVINERGLPRHGYPIRAAGSEVEIGTVTSGGHSPTLQKGIGLGYVPVEHADVETEIAIEVRGKAIAATVVQLPFYKRPR